MCALKHARWFKEAGHPVLGAALKNSPLEEHFKKHDIPCLSLTARGYFSFSDSLKLRRFIKENNVNTVYVHHLKDLWRLRVGLIGLPHVQVIGFARMFLRNVNKKDLLHRWIYRRLKTLVSLTEIQKESLLNCLPLNDSDITVIPDSVNTEEFHPRERNDEYRKEIFRLRPNELAIGLVGRIDPQKGSREFVEAAKSLCENHPFLKFFLIGKETPDTPGFEKSLKDYVSSFGLSERILFLGHRSDVHKVLANLDVFVMPSYEETFGDVLIESMSCEVPSVATRAGGPINIIDENENGILIPPKDAPALAQAIDHLIKNKSWAKELAKNGRQKALSVYDEKKIFQAIKDLRL